MTRPPIDQAVWQPWIDHVCAAVGVDARRVELGAIHALAGTIAATYERPMGPVAAHLRGIAQASGQDAADVDRALAAAARDAAQVRD